MRTTLKMALIVFFVTACVSVVTAQPGGPGGPGGPGPGGMNDAMRLLGDDTVKSQLGLSEEQVQKLQSIAEEYRPGRQGQGRQQRQPRQPRQGQERQGRQDRPGPPSQEDMQRFRAEMEKRIEEMQSKINEVLTPEQQEKLKVLRFQAVGGLDSPFFNSRMLESVVVLTAEQKDQIRKIEDERGKTIREAMEKRMANVDFRGLTDEQRREFFEKGRAEMETLNKKFNEQIQAVLTTEQLEKVKKLTEEGKSLYERLSADRRGPRGPGGPDRPQGPPPEGEYRPGADSWTPGQGAKGQGPRPRGKAFPSKE